MLVGELDEAVVLLAIALGEPFAHLADEGAGRIGLRLEAVGDLADRVVAVLQLLFVDIGIVDAVDVERAQRVIVRNFKRLIMLVAKRFEEIHVDDGGAGGDDRVDHVGAHQLGIKVHAAARRGRTGDDEDDRAVLVLEHLVVDARSRGARSRLVKLILPIASTIGRASKLVMSICSTSFDSSSALRVSLIGGVHQDLQNSVIPANAGIQRKQKPGFLLPQE